jgi:hypothetical protein
MNEKTVPDGATLSIARARKMSDVLKGAVLGRPLPTRDLEPPVLGASESCWLCHEHDNGETVCHEIPCR